MTTMLLPTYHCVKSAEIRADNLRRRVLLELSSHKSRKNFPRGRVSQDLSQENGKLWGRGNARTYIY